LAEQWSKLGGGPN